MNASVEVPDTSPDLAIQLYQRGRISRIWARLGPYSLTLGIAIALAAAWEIASGRIISEVFVSKPSAIWASFLVLTETGKFSYHLPITIQEAAFGFVIGTAGGVLLGLMTGRVEFLAKAITPFVIGFYTMPKLALAPLFIIWFGIAAEMKIALTSTVVFFPVYMVTFAGMREVSQELLGITQVMGASRFYAFSRVILPSTLVWLFVGLKQSVPYALLGAVVGELIASNRGMGFLMRQATGSFDTATLFAALFVLVAIGYGSYEFLRFLEGRLLWWKKSGDGTPGTM
ncbi:MAG: ABC transporter permease [Chloroflexota bacterium]|nr:MAG: ABC transporter permease [Chloroflexota bacterium]